MTPEEAIEYLTRCADGFDPDFDCAVSIAVSALRAQVDTPLNDPLNQEQLREMDGEPVWCVDGRGNACWCLVNVDDGTPHCYDNETGFWDGAFYGMSGDEKHGLHVFGWLAYRHKPEKGEEHGKQN